MRNLKKLILTSGMSAALVATGLTGCSMFHNESSDRSEGRQLDDKIITERVQEKLQTEPVYKFTDVDVKTFAGVVQLSGFVNTDEQKRKAGELAQNVEGVARVVNNISLKPGSDLTPTSRTNQVHQSDQQ
jgi:osmotically-inducible protein OsmY